MAMNVRSTVHVLNFLRECDHASLLHLSTCYVIGLQRDGRDSGRASGKLHAERAARQRDAEKELQSLEIAGATRRKSALNPRKWAEELSPCVAEERTRRKGLHGAALENQLRKNQNRWLRVMGYFDQCRQRSGRTELGWPNTYMHRRRWGMSEISDSQFTGAESQRRDRSGAATAIVESSI